LGVTVEKQGAPDAERISSRHSLWPRILCAALAVGAAGCSSSSDGGNGARGETGTSLEEALAAVPDSAAGKAILYADVATTRELVAKDQKQFSGL
jgi:hypothetical protein